MLRRAGGGKDTGKRARQPGAARAAQRRMPPRTPRRAPSLWSCGALLALLAMTPARALPPIRHEVRVALSFDVIVVAPPEDGRTVADGALTLDPIDAQEARVAVAWPGSDVPATLVLSALGRAGDGEHSVTAASSLHLPDGRIVRADWGLRIGEGTTRIVEAYAQGKLRVLLALRADAASRPVLGVSTRFAPQVRFRLEIQWVDGATREALETNILDTFLGEPVEYSFERGQGDDLETLRVALRPLRLDGDVAEVEVEVDGTLPGTPHRVVLSRRERLLTTRGALSSLTVASGDPPRGYAFVLRPDW